MEYRASPAIVCSYVPAGTARIQLTQGNTLILLHYCVAKAQYFDPKSALFSFGGVAVAAERRTSHE